MILPQPFQRFSLLHALDDDFPRGGDFLFGLLHDELLLGDGGPGVFEMEAARLQLAHVHLAGLARVQFVGEATRKIAKGVEMLHLLVAVADGLGEREGGLLLEAESLVQSGL